MRHDRPAFIPNHTDDKNYKEATQLLANIVHLGSPVNCDHRERLHMGQEYIAISTPSKQQLLKCLKLSRPPSATVDMWSKCIQSRRSVR
mmetsp:Transcript_2631/g.4527  ORF Transcript_2631/g.4527 Transcript_2631/m.4527 type:complete len:89 (-) Transcript_2631:442-708(-)